jgi:hypothetical protein
MSHSSGKITKLDGTLVGYFEYNGTVDTALPRIHDTLDEVAVHWREPEPFRHQCDCAGDLDIFVHPYSDEDRHWQGKMCTEHKCIVGGTSRPFEGEEGYIE